MISRFDIFDIFYALAARNGRDQVLFGTDFPQAREAFARSLAGEAFPELWFELPLAGEPWFDLHVLTAQEALSSGKTTLAAQEALSSGETTLNAEHPGLFAWFAQAKGARQLALSWDTGSGTGAEPAVQLLRRTDGDQVVLDFLDKAGRSDARSSYSAFSKRIPESWFACYMGTFPERPGLNLRVECIPSQEQQRAYAEDPRLLQEHLRQVGLEDLGDTLVERCQRMARTPFQLEFQFDVRADGSAGPTFGASVRFSPPLNTEEHARFAIDGACGELMQQVETWGLADGRWRRLVETIFAKRVALGEDSVLAVCYPAFLKLRWRDGQPLDAKTYLIAYLD